MLPYPLCTNRGSLNGFLWLLFSSLPFSVYESIISTIGCFVNKKLCFDNFCSKFQKYFLKRLHLCLQLFFVLRVRMEREEGYGTEKRGKDPERENPQWADLPGRRDPSVGGTGLWQSQ
jgi:hypothetical protein